MLSPNQVYTLLGVSSSTVRRWSVIFQEYLSPQKGKHRAYTPDDFAILKRVRDLSGEGILIEDIRNMLKVRVIDEPKVSEGKGLVVYEDFIEYLELSRSTIQRLELRIKEQEEKIDQLLEVTEYLSLPFYKRLGRRKPK